MLSQTSLPAGGHHNNQATQNQNQETEQPSAQVHQEQEERRHHRSSERTTGIERPTLGQRKRKCPTRAYRSTNIPTEAYNLPPVRTQSEGRKSTAACSSSSPIHRQQHLNQTLRIPSSDLNGSRKRSRSATNSVSSVSSIDSCPPTEYRQQFRCSWFTPNPSGLQTGSRAAAGSPAVGAATAAHANEISNKNMMMTRSATSEGLRRELSPVDPSSLDHVPRNTEYTSKFQQFDNYIYVDDVHGFQFKHESESNVADDGAEGGDGRTTPFKTWLDQVNERHGQAIVFARRSHAGAGQAITGFESLSKMYEELDFPFPKDRELNALALATTRLFLAEKRKDKSPRSQSVMSGRSRRSDAAAAASSTGTPVTTDTLKRRVVSPDVRGPIGKTAAAAGSGGPKSTGKRKHSQARKESKASSAVEAVGKRNTTTMAAAGSPASTSSTTGGKMHAAGGGGGRGKRAVSPTAGGKVWLHANKKEPSPAGSGPSIPESAELKSARTLKDAEISSPTTKDRPSEGKEEGEEQEKRSTASRTASIVTVVDGETSNTPAAVAGGGGGGADEEKTTTTTTDRRRKSSSCGDRKESIAAGADDDGSDERVFKSGSTIKESDDGTENCKVESPATPATPGPESGVFELDHLTGGVEAITSPDSPVTESITPNIAVSGIRIQDQDQDQNKGKAEADEGAESSSGQQPHADTKLEGDQHVCDTDIQVEGKDDKEDKLEEQENAQTGTETRTSTAAAAAASVSPADPCHDSSDKEESSITRRIEKEENEADAASCKGVEIDGKGLEAQKDDEADELNDDDDEEEKEDQAGIEEAEEGTGVKDASKAAHDKHSTNSNEKDTLKDVVPQRGEESHDEGKEGPENPMETNDDPIGMKDTDVDRDSVNVDQSEDGEGRRRQHDSSSSRRASAVKDKDAPAAHQQIVESKDAPTPESSHPHADTASENPPVIAPVDEEPSFQSTGGTPGKGDTNSRKSSIADHDGSRRASAVRDQSPVTKSPLDHSRRESAAGHQADDEKAVAKPESRKGSTASRKSSLASSQSPVTKTVPSRPESRKSSLVSSQKGTEAGSTTSGTESRKSSTGGLPPSRRSSAAAPPPQTPVSKTAPTVSETRKSSVASSSPLPAGDGAGKAASGVVQSESRKTSNRKSSLTRASSTDSTPSSRRTSAATAVQTKVLPKSDSRRSSVASSAAAAGHDKGSAAAEGGSSDAAALQSEQPPGATAAAVTAVEKSDQAGIGSESIGGSATDATLTATTAAVQEKEKEADSMAGAGEAGNQQSSLVEDETATRAAKESTFVGSPDPDDKESDAAAKNSEERKSSVVSAGKEKPVATESKDKNDKKENHVGEQGKQQHKRPSIAEQTSAAATEELENEKSVVAHPDKGSKIGVTDDDDVETDSTDQGHESTNRKSSTGAASAGNAHERDSLVPLVSQEEENIAEEPTADKSAAGKRASLTHKDDDGGRDEIKSRAGSGVSGASVGTGAAAPGTATAYKSMDKDATTSILPSHLPDLPESLDAQVATQVAAVPAAAAAVTTLETVGREEDPSALSAHDSARDSSSLLQSTDADEEKQKDSTAAASAGKQLQPQPRPIVGRIPTEPSIIVTAATSVPATPTAKEAPEPEPSSPPAPVPEAPTPAAVQVEKSVSFEPGMTVIPPSPAAAAAYGELDSSVPLSLLKAIAEAEEPPTASSTSTSVAAVADAKESEARPFDAVIEELEELVSMSPVFALPNAQATIATRVTAERRPADVDSFLPTMTNKSEAKETSIENKKNKWKEDEERTENEMTKEGGKTEATQQQESKVHVIANEQEPEAGVAIAAPSPEKREHDNSRSSSSTTSVAVEATESEIRSNKNNKDNDGNHKNGPDDGEEKVTAVKQQQDKVAGSSRSRSTSTSRKAGDAPDGSMAAAAASGKRQNMDDVVDMSMYHHEQDPFAATFVNAFVMTRESSDDDESESADQEQDAAAASLVRHFVTPGKGCDGDERVAAQTGGEGGKGDEQEEDEKANADDKRKDSLLLTSGMKSARSRDAASRDIDKSADHVDTRHLLLAAHVESQEGEEGDEKEIDGDEKNIDNDDVASDRLVSQSAAATSADKDVNLERPKEAVQQEPDGGSKNNTNKDDEETEDHDRLGMIMKKVENEKASPPVTGDSYRDQEIAAAAAAAGKTADKVAQDVEKEEAGGSNKDVHESDDGQQFATTAGGLKVKEGKGEEESNAHSSHDHDDADNGSSGSKDRKDLKSEKNKLLLSSSQEGTEKTVVPGAVSSIGEVEKTATAGDHEHEHESMIMSIMSTQVETAQTLAPARTTDDPPAHHDQERGSSLNLHADPTTGGGGGDEGGASVHHQESGKGVGEGEVVLKTSAVGRSHDDAGKQEMAKSSRIQQNDHNDPPIGSGSKVVAQSVVAVVAPDSSTSTSSSTTTTTIPTAFTVEADGKMGKEQEKSSPAAGSQLSQQQHAASVTDSNDPLLTAADKEAAAVVSTPSVVAVQSTVSADGDKKAEQESQLVVHESTDQNENEVIVASTIVAAAVTTSLSIIESTTSSGTNATTAATRDQNENYADLRLMEKADSERTVK